LLRLGVRDDFRYWLTKIAQSVDREIRLHRDVETIIVTVR